MQGGAGHEVLSNKEIERLHNGLVECWQRAGYAPDELRSPQLRAAFIVGLARAIEYAVIARVAPQMVGGLN